MHWVFFTSTRSTVSCRGVALSPNPNIIPGTERTSKLTLAAQQHSERVLTQTILNHYCHEKKIPSAILLCYATQVTQFAQQVTDVTSRIVPVSLHSFSNNPRTDSPSESPSWISHHPPIRHILWIAIDRGYSSSRSDWNISELQQNTKWRLICWIDDCLRLRGNLIGYLLLVFAASSKVPQLAFECGILSRRWWLEQKEFPSPFTSRINQNPVEKKRSLNCFEVSNQPVLKSKLVIFKSNCTLFLLFHLECVSQIAPLWWHLTVCRLDECR